MTVSNLKKAKNLEQQFDVTVAVIHDDRLGKSVPLEKTKRYSFATEAEALAFARKIEGLQSGE